MRQGNLFPGGDADRGSRGVLEDRAIWALIEDGRIWGSRELQPRQVQPASLDLRLGREAFEVGASILPSARQTIAAGVESVLVRRIDLRRGALLEVGKTYVIPILEHFRLPRSVRAEAIPKSTTGRIDLVARLLTDWPPFVDAVPRGFHGDLYLEVSSRSFRVEVSEGDSLCQMRFLTGRPARSDAFVRRLQSSHDLVFDPKGQPLRAVVTGGVPLSISLTHPTGQPVGFRAVHSDQVLRWGGRGELNIGDFWEPLVPEHGTLTIAPDTFYLFSSRERLAVPSTAAAVMLPYAAATGEFLFHYAGFFDPGFGTAVPGGLSAALALRSRWLPVYLHDGLPIARLVFEPLLGPPEECYGPEAGSSYHDRSFPMARQFLKSSPSPGDGFE